MFSKESGSSPRYDGIGGTSIHSGNSRGHINGKKKTQVIKLIIIPSSFCVDYFVFFFSVQQLRNQLKVLSTKHATKNFEMPFETVILNGKMKVKLLFFYDLNCCGNIISLYLSVC